MSNLIDRQAAIDAIEEVDWYHQNKNKDMVSGANSSEHQAWYKADDIYNTLDALPTVKAIPVEWIETYIDEHWSDECYLDGVGRTLEKVIARWRTECEK